MNIVILEKYQKGKNMEKEKNKINMEKLNMKENI